jgi:hypothetical protein
MLDLLSKIINDDDVKTKKYSPKIRYDINKLKQWREFREELKHQNRYFPKKIPDFKNLKNLFELLTLPPIDIAEDQFRARINTSSVPYTIEQMGKPPNSKVPDGRANPKGISYLYTASDVETALAEVRPFKGDHVTVVKFEVMEPMALVDLRNPKHSISPFQLEDDDLDAIYKDMPYLVLLGDELSKPIGPQIADLEYLPSQYLCEFVKNIGFEGIVYRSSLAKGANYAFFEENKLERKGLSQYVIDDINIEFTEI